MPPAAAIWEGGGAALAGDARQRRATSFPYGRRRRHTDQRNGEYGDEAMHWIDEWLSVSPLERLEIV
ncbi:MAG TPA: hypothetical protein VN729_05845 [Ktedonobacteraceae bacterium]|nr:hypothetical protein [Ktedonobacteraceae bacterium]